MGEYTRPARALAGETTHDGRPLKYAHGQRSAYVLDKCRCDPCTVAAREAGREARNRLAPVYVGADPARQHVKMLGEHGVGLKQIIKISGVPSGTLWKLVYGRNGTPSTRVRKETLDRILAVMPSVVAAGSKIDAAPTWKLIEEMLAAGVPRSRIAEHLGQRGPGLQLGRTVITPRNARAVAALHADWTSGRVELVRRDRHGGVRVAAPTRREPDYIDRAAILLDLAEILETRNARTWRNDAACRNRPPHIWFPARGDRRMIDAAKKICRSCLVRSQCLAENIGQVDGVFGALTAGERRDLRRADAREIA